MSDSTEHGKLYLIERADKDADFRYYAEHGEMGGVPDAIGYETAVHAKKFRTEDEAQAFIRTQLPQWGRDFHRVVELDFTGCFWEGAELSAFLWFGITVPDKLLEPTPGRLRIWRC